MSRAVHIVRDDIEPRHRGKPKTHVVPLSRKLLGAFVRDQMFLEGFFVPQEIIKSRRLGAGLAIVGHSADRDVYVDQRTGRHFRGIWAYQVLSDASGVCAETLERLATGGHRKSPSLLTILKVFRALRLQLLATSTDESNVDLIVQGW